MGGLTFYTLYHGAGLFLASSISIYSHSPCRQRLRESAAAKSSWPGAPRRRPAELAPATDARSALIAPDTDYKQLVQDQPWLASTLLVVKPDQLTKRRGEAGLAGAKLGWQGAQGWVAERVEKEIQVEHAIGVLGHFIVEPFLPHEQRDERRACAQSGRGGEEALFCSGGGAGAGDVGSKAKRLRVDIDDDSLSAERILQSGLLGGAPGSRSEPLAPLASAALQVFRKLSFARMEINPVVYKEDDNGAATIVPLDLAAKIDETAPFLSASQRGRLGLPAPLGREELPEEACT